MTGRLAVDNAGTLTATLEAPGDRVVTLLRPDSPFTLIRVSVEDADLVLIGTIDLDSLLP